MKQTRLMGVGVVAALLLTSGCLERELVSLNPCLVTGVARQIEVQSIDKVDLLFVVDNSNSMSEEQDALKAQFPKLIQTLTSGERADGTKFPAVKNLHLGVVSSDMGLTGVPNAKALLCDANVGDDGLLQHAGNGTSCQANYPNFLTFEYGSSNPMQVAQDFACIATLGTGGCGIEQQLESGLKALWPKTYLDAMGKPVQENPITFLTGTGHGDTPIADGGNGGFLRNSATEGQSLVAVVIVTDEEDCSSKSLDHFSGTTEPINLRCFLHKENLYDVERYVTGFKQLRPGSEHLVIFGAIAGVPKDLVDAGARAKFNDLKDDESREAYYDAILNDPRMQEVPAGPLTDGRTNLTPSCKGKTAAGKDAPAYPPIRMVQVARAFGQNGVVQSICEDDFGPAMDAIIRAITDRIPSVCLPRPLIRNAENVVPCNMIWELPPAESASSGAPTACDSVDYLEPVDANRAAKNERGGVNCKVRQLPVTEQNTVPAGKGWYYDNFAEELKTQCVGREQRVSFTEGAKPANGVVVKLECFSETQRVRSTDNRRMPDQPEIGSECGALSGNSCTVNMKDGSTDDSLFCHPQANVCVQQCQGSADCPPAWVCDKRKESLDQTDGRGFCVNPTCGSN